MLPLAMIPLPSLAAMRGIALAAAIVGAGIAGWSVRGTIAERDILAINNSILEQRVEAAQEAREDERNQQEIVNEALRKQHQTVAGINARLLDDLDRLRQRPERPAGVPEAPRADCAGANGAELGGSHAIFLRRYAAAAARCDAALEACYRVIDGTPHKTPHAP